MSELDATRRWIARYRETVERKTDGLDPEQLAERAVPPSTLSPLGLVRHLAQLEHHWFVRVLQRSDEPQLFVVDGDWDAQFDGALGTPECVEEAFATWREACARADAFLDELPVEALDLQIGPPDEPVSTIRDVLLQVLQEYARHCGHLDLLCERIDGRTGVWPATQTPRGRPGRAPYPRGVTETPATTPTSAPASAWGHGLVTTDDASGAVLDVWFPAPALGEFHGGAAPAYLSELAGTDETRRVTREVRTVVVEDLQAGPASTEDAWLRLHLLSHRLVAPRTVSVDGIFGLLTNVVWTSAGPCAVADFEDTRGRLMASGQQVAVYGVDKFPRMVDYVLPTGVRIADADRVRLGAHLAEGTTVMHEGFVNFNAGTLGASMVEGRISAGVVVGDGSDVGGGASIMGTLSGGGTQVISVGERCLIGANAGIGISLGDDCVVEAGCYVTAGTKVTVLDVEGKPKTVKALELSGADHVLFRRNSVSGAIEAVPWKSDGVALNAALHAN